MGRVRSPKRRVRWWRFYRRMCRLSSDYRRIILGLSSNRLSIGGSTSGSFRWNLQLQDFVADAVFREVGGWLYLLHALEMRFHMWRRSLMTFILRGRRSIWWGWRVTSLAPRIGNELSYVTQIIDDIHFAWQAQYLVKCEPDFSWQAQHFVGYRRIMVESSFYWRKALQGFSSQILTFKISCRRSIWWGWRVTWQAPRIGMTFHMWRRPLMTLILCGRCSIWWGWRVTSLAPRIGNEVSYVTHIIDDIHFAWQAQYLVRLEGGFTCSTHWKWGFICDADHWWHSFCVAGAVFGEVRVGLFRDRRSTSWHFGR